MRGILLVVCVGAAGCEVLFPFTPGLDAGGVDPVDAGPDAATAPFSTPRRVGISPPPPSSYFDVDPALFAGETRIAFVRGTPTTADTFDIYLASLNGGPDDWNLASAVPVVSQAMRIEENPKLDPDGLVMWIATRTSAMPLSDVTAYRRPSAVSTTWADTTASDAAGLSTTEAEERPSTPTANLERMVILRDNQLFEYGRIAGAGPWTALAGTLEQVNALGIVRTPHLSSDGLALAFSFNDGSQADLYVATRPTTGDPFDAPTAIPGVNTAGNESDPWLSDDRRRLWFARQGAPLPMAEWGIYYAER